MTISNPQKIAVAKLQNINDVLSLLNECKTKYGSLIGKNAHETVVNAATMEAEAALIASFQIYLEDIKQNKFHEQE